MADILDRFLATPAPSAPRGKGDVLDTFLNGPSAPAPQAEALPESGGPGLGESTLRGVKQGLTFGLGDEITGALESAFSSFQDPKKFKTYERARDEARAADKAARAAHPIGFGLGEALGTVGAGAVTGGAAGALAKGSLAATAGVAGAEGALQGIGNSEATDAAGLAKDAALGGALGAAGGAVAGKLFGGYANSAIKRNAKNVAEEVTQGANMVNKRRFAQVQELAADVLDKDPALARAVKARDPSVGLEAVENGLDKLGPQTAPKYAKIDANYRPMTVSEVASPIDSLIAKYEAEPGKETIAGALTKMRDNFVAATTRGGLDPATTPVPTAMVRKWTSNLLSEADSTMGSIAETERYKIKDQLHEVADGILKNHIEDAAKASPAVKKVTDELRELNKQITVLVKLKDVLNVRNTKDLVGHRGLAEILGRSGVPLAAGIAAAGGDLVSGGLAYTGIKAASAVAGGANKAATAFLARLMRAAKAGGATQQMALDALSAGVPNATVQGALALSRSVSSVGGEESFPGGVPVSPVAPEIPGSP